MLPRWDEHIHGWVEEPTHEPKGMIKLLDGRLVPEFSEQYRLPISTHRPHKWAMIDMQTGQVFVLDPEKPPDSNPVGATKEDLALLRKALKKQND